MFDKDIFVKMPRCEYLLTIDSSLLRGPTEANFLLFDNRTFIGEGVLFSLPLTEHMQTSLPWPR